MLTRRLMLGTMGALAAPAIVHAASDTIRLGYIADYQNVSLPAIAADQKMWQAEGLVPDVKVFTNGPIQIQAMGAGSLDFGAIGPGALWLPASGRTKVVAVNLLTFSDRVIGQPDITSIAALKGKKVGVPQGTSGEMILRLALGKAAMTVDDIQVIPMDPSTIVAAFSSKQIDGAGLWYPLVEVIKRRVPFPAGAEAGDGLAGGQFRSFGRVVGGFPGHSGRGGAGRGDHDQAADQRRPDQADERRNGGWLVQQLQRAVQEFRHGRVAVAAEPVL
jgi:ABC-type amino acid transport substrate-binding protein